MRTFSACLSPQGRVSVSLMSLQNPLTRSLLSFGLPDVSKDSDEAGFERAVEGVLEAYVAHGEIEGYESRFSKEGRVLSFEVKIRGGGESFLLSSGAGVGEDA